MKILILLLLFTPLLYAAPIQEDVVYKTIGKTKLHLFITKPEDWKASDKRPVIVWFHGGGWTGGSVKQFQQHADHFAKLGIVSAMVEYRLLKFKSAPPKLPCEDAKSAIRWVRSHADELGIDPHRLATGGGSAGGHLAAFTGLVDGTDDPADDLKISAKPQALLLFNPVLDNGPNGGWGNQRVRDKTKKYSPAHNVTKDAPPAIIFLGTKDKLIPLSTMERFQKNMKDVGVNCELYLYEGKEHGFFNKEPDRTDTIAKTEDFLRKLGWIK